METCRERCGVNIKEEKFDAEPPVPIKPEPGSPEPFNQVHHQPPPPNNHPINSSRPLGRFAPPRAYRDPNKAVDLSDYQFGLYSFYAEGNDAREYDQPHFDPYYGETDIKDPALLARAKRYFEHLRQEQCEEEEDYQMREQGIGRSREHRPMYQRKRKKLQKLVILVPKIRISPTIQEFLRRRYPAAVDSDRTARWAARRKCKSSESVLGSSLQETKLEEFMSQFRTGSLTGKSRPYSVSQRAARLESRPPSSCSSQQSSCLSSQEFSDLGINRLADQEFSDQRINRLADQEPSDQGINRLADQECQQPAPTIKPEPMDYDDSPHNPNPLYAVKQEMLECSHYQPSFIKREPVDYYETNCPLHTSIPETSDLSPLQNTSLTAPSIQDSPLHTNTTLTAHPSTKNSENGIQGIPDPKNGTHDPEKRIPDSEKGIPDSENGIPDPEKGIPDSEKGIPDCEKGIPDCEKGIPDPEKGIPDPEKGIPDPEKGISDSNGHPSCNPIPPTILPLPSNNEKIPLNLPLLNSEPISKQKEEDERRRKKKKHKKQCIPFPIKLEPSEEDDNDKNAGGSSRNEINAAPPEESSKNSPPKLAEKSPVTIKKEPLEPEQMRMVEIFRKRVKRLKKIEVKPLVAVKEEPMDFEDLSPEIKEEPTEATMLFITPKEPAKPAKKQVKFVYGRRVQGRARMSAAHPWGPSSVDTDEFDSAAKLETPFSPPKSAWSKITTPISRGSDSDDETEESRGLTAQIDKLIEAGNIQTLDDTEKMYRLFADAIKDMQDPRANVFNLVLERFQESKAFEKSMATAGKESGEDKAKSLVVEEETSKPPVLKTLFPMSDQEIYNQGLAVVGETKPPDEFEMPTVKVEQEDSEVEAPETFPTPGSPEQKMESPNMLLTSDKEFSANVATLNEGNSPGNLSGTLPSSAEFSRISPIRIRNSLEKLNKPGRTNSYHPDTPTCTTTTTTTFEDHPNTPITSTFEERPAPLYVDSLSKPRRTSDEKIRVVDEPVEDLKAPANESGGSEERPARQKSEISEAERLFDEMLADEEQASFQSQEPNYMEPFPRNDTLFANSSLDDFIKAPLSSNEHLVKPKPSYVRMSYHDSSESADGLKPPTVLFSSNSKPENPEWSQWRRHHESFDQFQPPAWSLDEQSNSWSPQHSIYDQYLEPPSSSASEDAGRIFDNNPTPTWVDSRRMSLPNPYPSIIERNEAGQQVVRIAVEQRTVQTQYPNIHCAGVEILPPVLSFIVQRQDNVVDIAIQTDLGPVFLGEPHSPLSSVLVEPLLTARKVSRPSPRTPSSESSSLPSIEQRTCQTQYPANNTNFVCPFQPSLPFRWRRVVNQCPVDSTTQTEGAPLFPPWVAPGRFRRHRPVLVEPLPNIEPIGDNVRTMRSSDAYSILMEQIRTSNDPSFDKFMNSQQQPNGVVSKFNKYACYAPQGNSPELPLTVKKNYPKKSGNVCKGKRPGIEYKEVSPQQVPSEHSNRGLTPYQISVKIRRMGQVENIIGRLSTPKKRKSLSPKR